MGNLFSSTPKKSQAELDAEFEAKKKKLMAEEAEIETQVAAVVAEKEQIQTQQFDRQKKLAEEEVAQVKNTIERAKQMHDELALKNVRVAILLCAIYHNYPFGKVNPDFMDDPPDEVENPNWQTNAQGILDECMNKQTWLLLCKLPQLLPLLWPTGDTEIEQKFHIYKAVDKAGNPDITQYEIEIEPFIDEYLTTSLKQYIAKVFESNCSRTMKIDTDYNDEIYASCKAFISSVERMKDDYDLIKRCMAFVQNEDKMTWKCFCGKAGKNVCSKPVKLLPKTYPKRSPRYECWCAILMLVNLCIAQYGRMHTKEGFDVKATIDKDAKTTIEVPYNKLTEAEKKIVGAETDKLYKVSRVTNKPVAKRSNTDTEGGRCFEIPIKWIESSYKNAFTDEVWDGKTYVSTETIVLKDDLITGEADYSKWMKNTILYNALEVFYNTNADATAELNGYVRYVNPTQRFTREFLNDIEFMELPFTTPALNAGINATFKANFLYNAFEVLTTKPENEKYDVFRTKNKNLMTCIDFMTLTPPELDEWQVDKQLPPLARYIYAILIQNACKWKLSLPINSAVTMSQINAMIMNDKNNKKLLPQYIWTRNDVFDYTTQPDNVTLAELPAPKQQVTNDTFVAANFGVIAPYTNTTDFTKW